MIVSGKQSSLYPAHFFELECSGIQFAFGELFEAFEAKFFDPEGGGDAPINHGLADGFFVGFSGGGKRPHQSSGKGVARAGGVFEGVEGIGVQ